MKIMLEEFQRTEAKSAMDLFHLGIKAEQTRKSYTGKMGLILCRIFEDFFSGTLEERATQFVEHARNDPEWAKDMMLSLSKKLRERTLLPKDSPEHLSASTIPNYFNPVRKLLDMNNVTISWTRIYATYPEVDSISDTRGWSRDEIKLMIKASGLLDTALILVMSSSGIRVGGCDFCWGDIAPVYHTKGEDVSSLTFDQAESAKIACARITIYRGTRYEYPAFVTPEAYHAVMNYKMQWMQETGCRPNADDHVFKLAGSRQDLASASTIQGRIYNVLTSIGLRGMSRSAKNHEVPQTNGFRRFWNKTSLESLRKDSPIASLIKKEYMMGHQGLTKLDKNYYHSKQLELAEEYMHAVPNLTISDESRLKAQIVQMQKDRKEESKMAQNQEQIMLRMQKQLDQRDEVFKEMMKSLKKSKIIAK